MKGGCFEYFRWVLRSLPSNKIHNVGRFDRD